MFRDLISRRLPELSTEKIGLLEAHYDLLHRWNTKINLTSISELKEIVERHYCESIFLGLHLPPSPVEIVDIGSGAGFPGVPIAVLRPDCRVSLVESHQRKAVFLREATRNLANVKVLAKRAEEVTARFDIAVSRAVSFGDLGLSLKKLASGAILLSGGVHPPHLLGFAWDPPIALPWGDQRFLWVGRVSRETHIEN